MVQSVLITLIVFLSAIEYGRLALIKFGAGNSRLFSFGVGIWIISHLVLLMGVFSQLHMIPFSIILAFPLVFFLFTHLFNRFPNISIFNSIKEHLPHGGLEWLIATAGLILIVLAFSGALTPPSHRDSLLYHLALPKLYLEKGQWFDLPQNIYSYFPGMTEGLYTLVLGLGADYPALVHFGFGVACIAATLELGSLLGLQRATRLLCAVALLATPTFWSEMTWSYADLANTFFWIMTIICFFRWQDERSDYRLVLLGFFIGAANCTKYTSLLLFVLLPLGLLLEVNRGAGVPVTWRKALRTVAIPVSLGVLTAMPWWLRNIILTGDPLFPFFLDLFPAAASGWDAERAGMYQYMLSQYGGYEKGAWDYVIAPFKVFIVGRVDDLNLYDGRLGLYYLLPWPLLFFLRSCPRKAFYLAGIIVIFLVNWTLTSQQARFLLVILPLISVLTGCLAEAVIVCLNNKRRLFTSATTNRIMITGVLLLLVLMNFHDTLGVYRQENYLSFLTGEKGKKEYLSAKLNYYEMYDFINTNLPGDARIFMVMTSNQGYYLDRPYFSDSIFESHTLVKLLKESDSAGEIAVACRQRGWTHLLIRPDFFFRLHEQDLPRDELNKFASFLNSNCRLINRSGPYRLLEITG